MESKELKFNAWAGFYLTFALIYIFLLYTEVTGFRLSQLRRVDEPVVEEHQETEGEQTDG